jgi:hypothetical protein
MIAFQPFPCEFLVAYVVNTTRRSQGEIVELYLHKQKSE